MLLWAWRKYKKRNKKILKNNKNLTKKNQWRMYIQISLHLMRSRKKNSVMGTVIAQAWRKENLAHRMTKISVKSSIRCKKYWMSWKENNRWRVQTPIIISKSRNKRVMKQNIIYPLTYNR